MGFGRTKAQVIEALGEPSREPSDFNEMENISSALMYHGTSVIYIERGKLAGFNIQDESLFLTYDDLTLRIGESMKQLQPTFPQNYLEDFVPGLVAGAYGVISITLQGLASSDMEVPFDEYVNFFYEAGKFLLTQIRHGVY